MQFTSNKGFTVMQKHHTIILLVVFIIAVAGLAVYRHFYATIEEPVEEPVAVNETEIQTAEASEDKKEERKTGAEKAQLDEDAIASLRELEENKSLDGDDDEALLVLARQLANSKRPAQQSFALDVLTRLGGLEAAKTCAELAESANQTIAAEAMEAFRHVVTTFEDSDKETLMPVIKGLIVKSGEEADVVGLLQVIYGMESNRYILQTYSELMKSAEEAGNKELTASILEFVQQSCGGDESIRTVADVTRWLKEHEDEE